MAEATLHALLGFALFLTALLWEGPEEIKML